MQYLKNQRVRLQLNYPLGRRLALAAIIIILSSILLETAARTSFIQSRIPFQAYGTNHIQFEFQVKNLDAFVARHGPPDCFILGNSMSLRGIDPPALNAAYQNLAGEDLLCYNFSIVGANLSITASFAQMLVNKYHPRLFILGTSFLDYSEFRERWVDSRFEENAWLHYQIGEFSLQGGLIEHSAAYRSLMLFSYSAYDRFDFTSVNKEVNKWSAQLSSSGYGFSVQVGNVTQPVKQKKNQSFLRQFGDFNISSRNLAAVDNILILAQQNQIQVILLQMPYHPSLVELLNADGQPMPQKEALDNYILQTQIQLQSLANANSLPYWSIPPDASIPIKSWHDRFHLNFDGSRLFSRWLAQQISLAVAQRQISDPAAGR